MTVKTYSKASAINLKAEFLETLAADEEEDNKVDIRIADETKIPRFFFNLILSHKRGAILKPRLKSANGKSNIPYLDNHNGDAPIGVVEKISLNSKEKSCYGKVRFSKNPHAQEVLSDVRDGIRLGQSPGIYIHEMELTEEGEHWSDDTYTVTKWEVLEVSSAPVPANENAYAFNISTTQTDEELSGLITEAKKRFQEQKNQTKELEKAMESIDPASVATENTEAEELEELEDTTAETTVETPEATVETTAETTAEVPAEVTQETVKEGTVSMTTAKEKEKETTEELSTGYVRQIISLAEASNQPALGIEALENNTSVEDFKEKLRSVKINTKAVTGTEETTEDGDDFNFARWIRHKANPDSVELKKQAEYDIEYLDAVRKEDKSERSIHGDLVPWKAFAGKRFKHADNLFPPKSRVEELVSTKTTAAQAGNLVATDLREEALIWPFLSQSMLIPRMTVYSGLVGNVDIPTITTEQPTPANVAEGVDLAAAAAVVFGKLTLTPKTLGGRVEITRRLMTQTDGLINAVVREMFDRQFSKALEDKVLANLLGFTNLPTEDFTTDLQPTYAEMVKMRQKLKDADVPGEKMVLMRPSVETHCLTTLKAAAFQEFIIHMGMIVDMPVETSTRFATAADGVLVGVLSEAVLGLWEGIDFVINRNEENGDYRISAWIDYDTDVKHIKAFVKNT